MGRRIVPHTSPFVTRRTPSRDRSVKARALATDRRGSWVPEDRLQTRRAPPASPRGRARRPNTTSGRNVEYRTYPTGDTHRPHQNGPSEPAHGTARPATRAEEPADAPGRR